MKSGRREGEGEGRRRKKKRSMRGRRLEEIVRRYGGRETLRTSGGGSGQMEFRLSEDKTGVCDKKNGLRKA